MPPVLSASVDSGGKGGFSGSADHSAGLLREQPRSLNPHQEDGAARKSGEIEKPGLIKSASSPKLRQTDEHRLTPLFVELHD